MAKQLISNISFEKLQEILSRVEDEISALETTRQRIETELSQRRNPNLDYGLAEFYVEV